MLGDLLGALLALAGVLLLYGGVFLRSLNRNLHLYGRSPLGALVVAVIAALCWPLTLCWWLFGPTPERTARREVRTYDTRWARRLGRRLGGMKAG